MQAVTYSEIKPRTAQGFLLLLVFSAATALVLTAGTIMLYLKLAAMELADWLDWAVVSVPVLAWVSTIIVLISWAAWYRARSRHTYRLSADDDGLTYASGQSTWRWPWSDLSRFEYIAGKWWRGEHVRFRPKSFTWKEWRKERRTLAAAAGDRKAFTRRGWEFYLLENFDVPLADLAAKLNDYRDRALAGDGTAAPA